MKKKYLILAASGFVLWITETALFGWNKEPVNVLEGILDFVSFMLMLWGIMGDILSGVTFQKTTRIEKADVYVDRSTENDRE